MSDDVTGTVMEKLKQERDEALAVAAMVVGLVRRMKERGTDFGPDVHAADLLLSQDPGRELLLRLKKISDAQAFDEIKEADRLEQALRVAVPAETKRCEIAAVQALSDTDDQLRVVAAIRRGTTLDTGVNK